MTDGQKANEAISAHPLQWPAHWERVQVRRKSAYKVTFVQARTGLLKELKLLGARGVVLSTNVELRRDGLPYSSRAEPRDSGAAVYWSTSSGRPMVCACDCWVKVRENLRAIQLTIAALRTIERTGASGLLERAYRGFAALPESTGGGGLLNARERFIGQEGTPIDSCWFHLGLSPAQGHTVDDARRAYRELSRTLHPDVGGDADHFSLLTNSYNRIVDECG